MAASDGLRLKFSIRVTGFEFHCSLKMLNMHFMLSFLSSHLRLKNFSSLRSLRSLRVRLQLKKCLDSGFVPSWLTRGRTPLLQNDKSKGNVASNYRPLTCLPLMWKLLTVVIADQIYAHLDQEKLLPEEQKGCRKGSRFTLY